MKTDSKARAAAGKPEHLGDLKDALGPNLLAPGLYVTSTPIGNARDITLRALDVLKGVDLIVAEDTRVTAKLLAIYGISKPLTAYNDHNAARERPRLLGRLRDGARIALVSDAGTPLVSDPGFKLVREAIQERLPVHAVPGASAALTGLVLSGLPSDRFLFAGFLPSKAGERQSALEELKSIRATLIFFESGPRLAETLKHMSEILGMRSAAVARELTKLHEELRRGTLAELAQSYENAPTPKGEVTLLVSPPHEAEADMSAVDAALDAALEFMPLKPASEMIANLTGVSRKDVYARGHRGEAWAAWWLRLKGHRILGRRVKTHAGEIDLITLCPFGPVCFVEVKARGDARAAAEAVTPEQRTRIARAASLYLASRPTLARRGARFDIVTIAGLPRHLPDAWRMDG